MEVNLLIHHDKAASRRLRVFSLYLDFPASIRARWANSTVSRLAGDNWVTSTEMWKLDSLAAGPAIRHLFTSEAAKADVLFVAVSSLNHRHHELIAWLETLGSHFTDRPHAGLLIGLFGDDADNNSELTWTVKQCRNCARPMNRAFDWHWMESGAMADDSWLKTSLQPFLAWKHTMTQKGPFSGLATAPTPALPLAALAV
jgi:hypothetical protein